MKGFSETIAALWIIYVMIYLFGALRRFQHCTGHITMGSWKGRGNQYIQFIRVLYCKLPTNSKQLPAFPLEAVPGIEPRPQRWEGRVLPLCQCGPYISHEELYQKYRFTRDRIYFLCDLLQLDVRRPTNHSKAIPRLLVVYMSCTSKDFVQIITCTKSCTSYNLYSTILH